MTPNELTAVFAALNLLGGVLFAVLMVYATPDATLKQVFVDEQARWAMARRALFGIMATGMIGKGTWTWAGWITPTVPDMLFWMCMVIPMGVLLALRVFHLVDQDRWLGVHMTWGGWFGLRRWLGRGGEDG